MVSSTVFLMMFVFLGGLGLRLTYITKRKIVGLSFISILILLSGFVLVFFS